MPSKLCKMFSLFEWLKLVHCKRDLEEKPILENKFKVLEPSICVNELQIFEPFYLKTMNSSCVFFLSSSISYGLRRRVNPCR